MRTEKATSYLLIPRQKISVDNQACFRYQNSSWFRLIDASICWVAAGAGTQFAIYDSSAPEKQLPIFGEFLL